MEHRGATSGLFDLKGKTALVTGGNRGIGRALALALAGAGANVAIVARDEDKNQAVAAEIRALGDRAMALRVDLAERSSLKPAFEHIERNFGPIDILVNNAAFAILKGVLEQSLDEWESVLTVNLDAAFIFAKYTAESMVRRKSGGKIINVSSIAGNAGSPIFPSYVVAKGGLQALTRCLAVELAAHNIQVNSLLPGWFSTDMTDWIRNWPEYAEVLKEMVQRTPRGRFGEPEELAGSIVYLASRASDHMTGAELIVDGGFSIR
jgi:2-dehydro-3-deoxy-D-gluconate 5-dehydrogenase